MPSLHSTHRPIRQGPKQSPLSHIERQLQQKSHMVREQPDDTPRDQRGHRTPLGERQMA